MIADKTCPQRVENKLRRVEDKLRRVEGKLRGAEKTSEGQNAPKMPSENPVSNETCFHYFECVRQLAVFQEMS